MTKTELKQIIKQVLKESLLIEDDAILNDPVNDVAKQIKTALDNNKFYKNADAIYYTGKKSSMMADAKADITANWKNSNGDNANIYVVIYEPNDIEIEIDAGSTSDKLVAGHFKNADDVIKFLNSKDPTSIYNSVSPTSDVLDGATILQSVDKGAQGKILTIVTKKGQKITGKFISL